ncbi:MAG: hypothetical protein KGI38_10035 [Thaumarchaeota archaeon]|nr:hypothetical protein [Nitrososphaerota archaeon]
MNLSVSDVTTTVKKFLAEDAGLETIRVTSAVAIEGEAEWKVTADIGQPTRDRKEMIVNDNDGKIISFKTGATAFRETSREPYVGCPAGET